MRLIWYLYKCFLTLLYYPWHKEFSLLVRIKSAHDNLIGVNYWRVNHENGGFEPTQSIIPE
jgi:hypothetical protein